jgi:cytochrome c oxidase subunit 2
MNDGTIGLHTFWLPKQGSTIAKQIDFAWDVVTWVSIFFFLLIIGAMCWFVYRYRRRAAGEKTSTVDHNLQLEVTWTIVPLAIVIGLFVVGFRGYVNAAVAPGDAYEIRVVAQKWSWTFFYPNGAKSLGELVVPAGRPVKLTMSAKDVLHSLYIPEFRVKQDVVPGAYTSLWFEALEPGETVIECTEYCGKDHSNMLAKVRVLDSTAFTDWVEKANAAVAGLPPEKVGEGVYHKICETCHSTDGTIKQAPSFKGLFGKQEEMGDGSKVAVDDNYLRESILNPTAKIVKGFQGVMPPFQGVLSEQEINGLIAFIKAQK